MALNLIDCIYIIRIYHSRSSETTQELSEEVNGETLPREFSKEAEAESHCRVQETTGVSSDIYAKHNSQAPSIKDVRNRVGKEGQDAYPQEMLWYGPKPFIPGADFSPALSSTCATLPSPNRIMMKTPKNSANGSLKITLTELHVR